MAQRTRELEARIERVDRELAELKAAVTGNRSQPWYRQIVGSFAGDEELAESIRLDHQIRRGKLKG